MLLQCQSHTLTWTKSLGSSYYTHPHLSPSKTCDTLNEPNVTLSLFFHSQRNYEIFHWLSAKVFCFVSKQPAQLMLCDVHQLNTKLIHFIASNYLQAPGSLVLLMVTQVLPRQYFDPLRLGICLLRLKCLRLRIFWLECPGFPSKAIIITTFFLLAMK